MGRRIAKTRRHKKLKFVDPCYSGPPGGPNDRKKRWNEPPTETDVQEVPSSMQQLIDVKTQVKQNKFHKSKKKKKKIMQDDFIIVHRDGQDKFQHGMTKAYKSEDTKVSQRKNETKYEFINRLQKMADTAIAEAQVEQKYDIDMVNIDQSGNTQLVFAEKKQAGAKRKEKRKRYEQKEKQKKRKRQKIDELDDGNYKKDEVKFGEVVLEPPMFLAKPRNAPETKVGKRDLALLKVLQDKSALNKADKMSQSKSSKRKHLLPAQRQMLENERLRAVDLYRSMKNKKKDS